MNVNDTIISNAIIPIVDPKLFQPDQNKEIVPPHHNRICIIWLKQVNVSYIFLIFVGA